MTAIWLIRFATLFLAIGVAVTIGAMAQANSTYLEQYTVECTFADGETGKLSLQRGEGVFGPGPAALYLVDDRGLMIGLLPVYHKVFLVEQGAAGCGAIDPHNLLFYQPDASEIPGSEGRQAGSETRNTSEAMRESGQESFGFSQRALSVGEVLRASAQILALCTLPTAPRAQTELTPWLFNLQSQFNDCLNAPSDDHSLSCYAVLEAGFTLRREIGNALDACLTTNVDGCVAAFNTAGFPTERLNIATLPPCTLLGRLEDIDITYLPKDNCIEHIARTIERHNIPTSHNSNISCGRSYVSCAEVLGMGARYWESAVWLLHQEKLDTVPSDAGFTEPVASHRYFSLLERQMQQRIDLAETTCNIQMMMAQRATTTVYEGCMGDAYADIWRTLKSDGDD